MGRKKKRRRKAAAAPAQSTPRRAAEQTPPRIRVLVAVADWPSRWPRGLCRRGGRLLVVAIGEHAAGAAGRRTGGRSGGRDLRRASGLRPVPRPDRAALARIPSRSGHAAADRDDGGRQLQRCALHLRRDHVDLPRRDGKFVVRTDGPDGTLADYEVKYTFGVSPLQQYLLELPNGRLQALAIAGDTRPRPGRRARAARRPRRGPTQARRPTTPSGCCW
jgi:hypothetical protein